MKKDRVILESVCLKCGEKQKPDEKMSNENWSVYKTNEKCHCGGEYSGVRIEEQLTV